MTSQQVPAAATTILRNGGFIEQVFGLQATRMAQYTSTVQIQFKSTHMYTLQQIRASLVKLQKRYQMLQSLLVPNEQGQVVWQQQANDKFEFFTLQEYEQSFEHFVKHDALVPFEWHAPMMRLFVQPHQQQQQEHSHFHSMFTHLHSIIMHVSHGLLDGIGIVHFVHDWLQYLTEDVQLVATSTNHLIATLPLAPSDVELVQAKLQTMQVPKAQEKPKLDMYMPSMDAQLFAQPRACNCITWDVPIDPIVQYCKAHQTTVTSLLVALHWKAIASDVTSNLHLDAFVAVDIRKHIAWNRSMLGNYVSSVPLVQSIPHIQQATLPHLCKQIKQELHSTMHNYEHVQQMMQHMPYIDAQGIVNLYAKAPPLPQIMAATHGRNGILAVSNLGVLDELQQPINGQVLLQHVPLVSAAPLEGPYLYLCTYTLHGKLHMCYSFVTPLVDAALVGKWMTAVKEHLLHLEK